MILDLPAGRQVSDCGKVRGLTCIALFFRGGYNFYDPIFLYPIKLLLRRTLILPHRYSTYIENTNSYLEQNFYMKFFLSILFISCIAISCSNDKPEPTASTTTVEKYDLSKDTSVYSGEMKRYWLVHLLKGPNRNQDSASRVKIQAAHIANIVRLAKEGKIIMAGPIGVENDIQGIFLMNCKDSSEVENFVRTDTAVITGRLIMKYYPWWCEKGKYIFK
jgi:uncharacterized protein YciI